jgi:hypothetical protein
MARREFVIKIPVELRKLSFEELLKLQKKLRATYKEIMDHLVDLSRQKTKVWGDMKAVDKLLHQLRKSGHEENSGGGSHP